MSRVGSWVRDAATDRLWPIASLIGVLALAATVSNEPGRYIGDNRYDEFAAPGRRLAHSLALWDGSRGLGRVREDLWLGFNLPLAALRALGVPVWLAERCFHAGLLAAGGIGVVALLRWFRPRIGLGHLLAALVYSFGPYSAAFLQPSNLYAACALVPWLALVALHGLSGERRWRWAAAFALLIGLLGNADPPGAVLAALVVLPVVVWSVAVERTTSLRHAVGWLVRCGVLTVGVAIASLFKTWVAAATFASRLDTTESPAIVSSSSSWTESLRGLGFWLTYFRGAGLARPQSEVYFANPVVILATLVVPVAAFGALAAVKGRARILFGLSALFAAVVMVGSYPLKHPSPYGRVVAQAYDAVPKLAAFRSSYKVGGLLALGIAALVGLGLDDMRGWLAERGRTRLVPTIAAFVVVAIAAVPFWSGSLYDGTKGYDSVPGYWTQAMRFVDQQPGAGRVLVLPGTTRTQYRWGWVGDDIIDALLVRDHAVDTAIPLSEPEAANLLHAVSSSVAEGTYEIGTIAPILVRLGIDRVVIRNDVDWTASRTIRPARLDALRRDPSLRLVRTFGRPGQNTVASGDRSTDGLRERRLAPVEVYELTRPGPKGARGIAPGLGSVLVSGDGDAWPLLSRHGDLTGTGPVRYSGDAADIGAALSDAGRVVVTDSNRRAVTTVNSFNLDQGPTLAAGQDQDRKASDLFMRAGSQTVAWYRDAKAISATGASRGLRGSQPATRPAAAFDHNSGTAWLTFESTNQVGLKLHVDFRQPTTLRNADITIAGGGAGNQRVTEGRMWFSDGTRIVVPLAGRSASVQFPARTVRWVEIEISSLSSGNPAPVGFSEIAFGDVDLQEWISLPDDLVRRALADPAAARRLAALPLTYQFSRTRSVGPIAAEPVLRRRFRVPSTRSFALHGTLRTTADDTRAIARNLALGCNDKTVLVDGKPFAVQLNQTVDTIRAGDPIPIVGCAETSLRAGWHRIEVTGSPVSDLWLESKGTAKAPAAKRAPMVRVVSTSAGHATLRVDAPDGGWLVNGQSWEPRWIAMADGHDLGGAQPVDTLSGWELPKGTNMLVTLDYRPQRRFGLVLGVSYATTVLCIALAAGWPRRRRRQAPADSSS